MLCTGGRSASIVVTGTRDEAASYPQGISGCLISGEVLVTSVMGSRSWRSGGEGSGPGVGGEGGVDDGVWEEGEAVVVAGAPGNSGTTTLPTCGCNFVPVFLPSRALHTGRVVARVAEARSGPQPPPCPASLGRTAEARHSPPRPRLASPHHTSWKLNSARY